MSQSTGDSAREFYALTYDDSVPDWPGELDFFQELALKATSNAGAVLEVACGTGRVAIRLAQQGVNMVGLDLSAEMLDVARQKSLEHANIRWVQGDMRSFDLEEKFPLIIIPGHAFQNLNDPQDQVACLECIHRHLTPGGTLVVHLDHQDVIWLGELAAEKGGVFEPAEQFPHPETGNLVRASRAWTYERASQTAVCQTAWEEVDEGGQVLRRWLTNPIRLHCVFPFEMEHLLGRTGYAVKAVYGDFFWNTLDENSSDMVWVARKA